MPAFTAFISDLHLSYARPPASRAFFEFLRGVAARADALYVLGDLFEYWAGDDDLDDPFNAEVAHGLRVLSAAGVPVHMIRGNRDFLLLEQFAATAGVHVMSDPAVVDLYGTPTLLMHGDLLCTQDHRYQMFRKVVRNSAVQRWFMRLPLDKRKSVVGGARRLSEGEKQAKQAEIMDVEPAAVEEAFRRHACSRLIHGHTHRPARHEHMVDGRLCERWVLSDWYHRGQYLRATANGCEPVEWPFEQDSANASR